MFLKSIHVLKNWSHFVANVVHCIKMWKQTLGKYLVTPMLIEVSGRLVAGNLVFTGNTPIFAENNSITIARTLP